MTSSSQPYNLVQTEFFLGRPPGSLEELESSIKERAESGASIKSTFRFYDETGDITEFAEKYGALCSRRKILLERFEQSKGWFYKKILSACIGWDLNRQIVLEAQAVHVARQSILDILEMKGELAIERTDRSFRLLRPDEYYDTKQVIKGSYSAWIFVARPNDFLTDKIDIFAKVM